MEGKSRNGRTLLFTAKLVNNILIICKQYFSNLWTIFGQYSYNIRHVESICMYKVVCGCTMLYIVIKGCTWMYKVTTRGAINADGVGGHTVATLN